MRICTAPGRTPARHMGFEPRASKVWASRAKGPVMHAEAYQDIKDRVRQFITASVAIADLDDDANLFESGIVNSLFAVQLTVFIEKAFRIEVGIEDLEIENFKSLNATASFVARKSEAAAA